jgi:hypothetical protein
MKEIKLSKGYVTMVDDVMFNYILQYKWYAWKGRYTYYAATHNPITGSFLPMQNFILNPPSGLLIDHRNGNALDNRFSNLRVCNLSLNNANKTPSGSSKYLGVFLMHYRKDKSRPKYIASIKSKRIGSFDSEIEAAIAYDKSALLVHGEFARLNFPNNKYDVIPKPNEFAKLQIELVNDAIENAYKFNKCEIFSLTI